jgi:hypothetical protein
MKKLSAALACVWGMAGCASIATVPGSCGSGDNAGVCFGSMWVPADHSDAFAKASQQVIDAVHSREFLQDLSVFQKQWGASGKHAAAWNGLHAPDVVAAMKLAMHGMGIETYGEVDGFFLRLTQGNMAFMGSPAGPIQMNRWALLRPSESLANTIAHEVAHRVGLMHPSSETDTAVAQCEPPYVIGSLVEKQLLGPGWRPGRYDCALLALPPNP